MGFLQAHSWDPSCLIPTCSHWLRLNKKISYHSYGDDPQRTEPEPNMGKQHSASMHHKIPKIWKPSETLSLKSLEWLIRTGTSFILVQLFMTSLDFSTGMFLLFILFYFSTLNRLVAETCIMNKVEWVFSFASGSLQVRRLQLLLLHHHLQRQLRLHRPGAEWGWVSAGPSLRPKPVNIDLKREHRLFKTCNEAFILEIMIYSNNWLGVSQFLFAWFIIFLFLPETGW